MYKYNYDYYFFLHIFRPLFASGYVTHNFYIYTVFKILAFLILLYLQQMKLNEESFMLISPVKYKLIDSSHLD